MFKLLLVIFTAQLYGQNLAADYNTRIAIRDRCETCMNVISSNNVDSIEIRPDLGFENFLMIYDEIQEYGVTDPQLICMLIDMCPVDAEPQSALNFIGELYADSDLEMAEELNVGNFFSLNIRNKACRSCKNIYKWVAKHIHHLMHKRITPEIIKGFLDKACNDVPSIFRFICRSVVKNKGKKLMKSLLDEYGANLACQKIFNICKK